MSSEDEWDERNVPQWMHVAILGMCLAVVVILVLFLLRRLRRGAGFRRDVARGLTSSTFDVEMANLHAGDTRPGLNERAAARVEELMRGGVDFDEARRLLVEEQIRDAGV